jgi:hypothetical protein
MVYSESPLKTAQYISATCVFLVFDQHFIGARTSTIE